MLPSLDGHFAFVVGCTLDDPADGRRAPQCPMVIGLGDGETLPRLGVVAFLEQTREAKLVGDASWW